MYKERIAGILLGIALGIGIVAIFVFVFSEDAIDSASLGGQSERSEPAQPQTTTDEQPQQPAKPEGPKSVEVTVQVVAGAPPEATGPAHLNATQGDKVTFNVESDATGTLSVTRYGISKTVSKGKTAISFTASKPGNFALINATTTIAVAQLRVSPR